MVYNCKRRGNVNQSYLILLYNMVSCIIKKRLREFKKLGEKGRVVFNFRPFLELELSATVLTELLFCIAAANSSAKSAIFFQKRIENVKVLERDFLENVLKQCGVRFYRRKARYMERAVKNWR